MLYINGKWHAGNGPALTSYNPEDYSPVWSEKTADSLQVEAAYEAARAAFSHWAALSYEQRLAYLTRWRDLVTAAQDELAELIARETGKILWDAKSEVAAVIGKLAFSEAAYQERTPERHQELPDGVVTTLRHKPHGVAAVYGPYNFPAHLPNGHIMPALLAGNTILFKPSEQTPAVAEWMVKKWEETGLPAGVMNLLQGDKEVGIALTKMPINSLYFTGSSATGITLHRHFAGRPDVLLALEMGGNNALVVHDISDVKAAAYETIQSAFISSGQRCSCARRLIITKAEWNEAFIKTLIDLTRSLIVGRYNDTPTPFIGPLISRAEADRVFAGYETFAQQGEVLLSMQRPYGDLPFLTPAIVDMSQVSERLDQEFFGPLLQLYRVKDLTAAIAEANRSAYGLSAGLLCNNPADFEKFSKEINAGIVNWNRQTTGASGRAPFGGVGLSGNHHPAGYYAADYAAYPVASLQRAAVTLPDTLVPGVIL